MKKHGLSHRLTTFIGSNFFFRLTIIALIIQAAWIALSADYPMAFDEEFHLGIIKLYAEHISPFWTEHPANGDSFGAVTRDVSYLYHYIMSFVYRIISLFTDSHMLQVMLLRALNIAMIVSCLPLFRKLLRKTGASDAAVNLCLAVFVFIPIVPFLGAHINYDNAVLPLVAIVLLLTHKLVEELDIKKKFNVTVGLQLLIMCLVTSLIKYAFLPIFLAIVLYVGYKLFKNLGSVRNILLSGKRSFVTISQGLKVGLLSALIIIGALFFERVSINLIRYHSPVPDCAKVLTVEQCSAYGPWNRDYNNNLNKNKNATTSVGSFSYSWVRGLWLRSFFTIASPNIGYKTRGPLTLPAMTTLFVAGIGLAALVYYGRRIYRTHNKNAIGLFASVIGLYLILLWYDIYKLYIYAGKPVAINGRYLLIIMPMLLLIFLLAYRELFAKRPVLKTVAATVLLISFMWGGGALTFIIRSSDSWYWPNSPLTGANHTLQKYIGPAVPGSVYPTQYLR